MKDRKQQRLDLLCRLRKMGVEQARADHIAARSELEERSSECADTENRIAALDVWQGERLAAAAPLVPELLRQAQLYRGAQKQTLEQQRADEAQSQQRTEAARAELGTRFEQLSAVERLTERHVSANAHQQLRSSYVELDDAGMQRKNLEAKE